MAAEKIFVTPWCQLWSSLTCQGGTPAGNADTTVGNRNLSDCMWVWRDLWHLVRSHLLSWIICLTSYSTYNPVRSQICTCHDSSAAVTCTKFWAHWLNDFYFRAMPTAQPLWHAQNCDLTGSVIFMLEQCHFFRFIYLRSLFFFTKFHFRAHKSSGETTMLWTNCSQ